MRHDRELRKGVLTVGFVALAAAVLAAHRAPASGYEVSIYAATPAAFWAGVAVALLAAVTVASWGGPRWSDATSVGLGGATVTTIVALPVLRSYYFYGLADPLTHLGWLRELSNGSLDPWGFIYPGTHLTSLALALFGGTSLRLSMQLLLVVFTVAFLAFVPLVVWQLTGDRRAMVLGAFAAFLLVPVNHTGFNLLYYPFSMTAFVAPLALYLFFRHARAEVSPYAGRLRSLFWTPAAGLFLLVGSAVVVLHPQTASALLVVVVAVAATQVLVGRRTATTTGRPVYGLSATFGGLFLLWSGQFSRLTELGSLFGESVLSFVTMGTFGQSIDQRTGSAEALGIGLPELFAKLFLLDAVFLALAGGLVLALVTGRLAALDRGRRRQQLYVGVGLAAVLPYAAIHLLGALSGVNYAFRHLGFAMVLATVLGAVALWHLDRHLGGRRLLGVTRRAAPAVAVLALALGMVTLYTSPFLYLPSQQVSAQQMDGYRTTFEHDGGLPVIGPRDAPSRYNTSFPGASARTGGDINDTVMRNGLSSYYIEDTLVVVSDTEKRRELVAYRGLRYSRASFRSVERDPGASRVVHNGEYRLYHVDAT